MFPSCKHMLQLGCAILVIDPVGHLAVGAAPAQVQMVAAVMVHLAPLLLMV